MQISMNVYGVNSEQAWQKPWPKNQLLPKISDITASFVTCAQSNISKVPKINLCLFSRVQRLNSRLKHLESLIQTSNKKDFKDKFAVFLKGVLATASLALSVFSAFPAGLCFLLGLSLFAEFPLIGIILFTGSIGCVISSFKLFEFAEKTFKQLFYNINQDTKWLKCELEVDFNIIYNAFKQCKDIKFDTQATDEKSKKMQQIVTVELQRMHEFLKQFDKD